MPGMPRFTHDMESTELTAAECTAYAELVQYACHRGDQYRVSAWLSCIGIPQPPGVCDFAQRQARKMWRTAVSL